MADHLARILWQRDGAAFTDGRYSRSHAWHFDGGTVVPASASPHVVALPMSVAEAVDPEEAFVAALASCHMLWFLSLAAKRGLVVDRYHDGASGTLGHDAHGKLAMTRVTLRPAVAFGGDVLPTPTEVHALHHAAHEACFLANSVRTEIRCEPVL